MEFFKDRIVCKSNEDNFHKERVWIKNNTLREVEVREYNCIKNFWENFVWKFIQIRNSETWEVFERQITDITLFKEWDERIKRSKKYEEALDEENFTLEKRFIFVISFREEIETKVID